MSKDKWCVIGHPDNKETQEMIDLIKEKTGTEPKFFAMYSTMMAFVRHSGLNENNPIAYHAGFLVAESVEDLKADFSSWEKHDL